MNALSVFAILVLSATMAAASPGRGECQIADPMELVAVGGGGATFVSLRTIERRGSIIDVWETVVPRARIGSVEYTVQLLRYDCIARTYLVQEQHDYNVLGVVVTSYRSSGLHRLIPGSVGERASVRVCNYSNSPMEGRRIVVGNIQAVSIGRNVLSGQLSERF